MSTENPLGLVPLIKPGSEVPARAPAPGAIGRLRTYPLADKVSAACRGFFGHATHGRRNRRIGWGVLAVLVVGLSGGGWMAFGPRSVPDVEHDPLDDILDFTLLTDDFNNMPVKERLAIIRGLVERLKNMGGGDALLMAGFAEGIAGKAREQLMENGTQLAVDVADDIAIKYSDRLADAKTDEERAKAIEETFVEFTREMEEIAGEKSEKSDQERLADARKQAGREVDMIKRQNARGNAGEGVGRMLSFMNDNLGSRASPQQRARITTMMRDMTRHFRQGPR